MNHPILIISKQIDISTKDVIEWLNFFNVNWIRINQEDSLKILKFNLEKNQFIIKCGNVKFNLFNIKTVWYRKGKISFEDMIVNTNNSTLDSYLQNEIMGIEKFLYDYFKDINHINTINDDFVSKLHVLRKAKSIGLNIPETSILFSIEEVKMYCDGFHITKAINDGSTIIKKPFKYTNFTSLLTSNMKTELCQFGDKWFKFPLLIQNKIEKYVELRVFHLLGENYTMAIFSQNDRQTEIDFRIYNKDKPNRTIPFKLPDEISLKINKLMKSLGFNSGSIDMIYTTAGQYVFLEVNPVGQFKQVSIPCNYKLEYYLAKALKKLNHE